MADLVLDRSPSYRSVWNGRITGTWTTATSYFAVESVVRSANFPQRACSESQLGTQACRDIPRADGCGEQHAATAGMDQVSYAATSGLAEKTGTGRNGRNRIDRG